MSGTFNTIGTANVTDTAYVADTSARCVTFLTRCNHPRVGQNLLITGNDRLGGGTSTSVVSQQSESEQGILGTKGGRGKYDMLYETLLSSCICRCRDMPWLDITSINVDTPPVWPYFTFSTGTIVQFFFMSPTPLLDRYIYIYITGRIRSRLPFSLRLLLFQRFFFNTFLLYLYIYMYIGNRQDENTAFWRGGHRDWHKQIFLGGRGQIGPSVLRFELDSTSVWGLKVLKMLSLLCADIPVSGHRGEACPRNRSQHFNEPKSMSNALN